MHQIQTLPNNLRIITSSLKQTKTATVLIMIKTGSKYETKDINGISHFIEHIMFKGTKKRPNTLAISEEIDRVGGDMNAFTVKDYTGYYIKVASKHLDLALDVLSDILLNSKFDPKEINRERGVIIEEINMYEDTPIMGIEDTWEKCLYGDQSAGWDIIGTKNVIANIKRNKFIEYIKNHYTAENMVICIAGDFKQDITKKVKKYFKNVNKRKSKDKEKVLEKQNKPNVLLKYKKTDQTHLCIGFRTYNIFHKDRFILEILSSILGGGMSSRLFISIRERLGLAYYIRSSANHNPDTGYLVVQAGIDNNKVDKAIKAILKEFKRIKKEKVSLKELQKVKDFEKGRMLLSLETSDDVAKFLTEQEILKREILTEKQIFKKIDRVSAEDIKRITNKLFINEGLNFALIGPFKDRKRFEKILEV